MRLKLPYDRSRHLKSVIHADTANPDTFTLQTTEELGGIIDFCKEKQEATRFDKDDGLRHVAEIPVSVYEQAVNEGWDTPEGWRQWANNPDNACFRTWKGRI